MFPRYPLSVIIADLQVTRSLELTVDNILEGRLIIPAHYQADEEDFEAANDGSPAAGASNSDSSGAFDYREGTSSVSDYYVNPSRFIDSSSNSTTPSSSPKRESTPTNGFESGYEIERNSNIFGNQNDLLRESSEDNIPLGDRFSKSSSEREKILARRKELMVAQARKR